MKRADQFLQYLLHYCMLSVTYSLTSKICLNLPGVEFPSSPGPLKAYWVSRCYTLAENKWHICCLFLVIRGLSKTSYIIKLKWDCEKYLDSCIEYLIDQLVQKVLHDFRMCRKRINFEEAALRLCRVTLQHEC